MMVVCEQPGRFVMVTISKAEQPFLAERYQNPGMTLYTSSDDSIKYSSQREKRNTDVVYLGHSGPPSSPPTYFMRLSIMTIIVNAAPLQKMVTENARLENKE